MPESTHEDEIAGKRFWRKRLQIEQSELRLQYIGNCKNV